jgi:hypothetical protein
MLAADFREAGEPKFAETTGCYLYHVKPDEKACPDCDFFDFPADNGKRQVEVGGDILAMFNRHTGCRKADELPDRQDGAAEIRGFGVAPSLLCGFDDDGEPQVAYPDDAMRSWPRASTTRTRTALCSTRRTTCRSRCGPLSTTVCSSSSPTRSN